MRLWSLHPRYLDPAGLVALWREGLLAQAVLSELTRGYRQHPQLIRFREHPFPIEAIGDYLHAVVDEADRRGYRFDRAKLPARATAAAIDVTRGQLAFEWRHLKAKLRVRNVAVFRALPKVAVPPAHPSFTIVDGDIAGWERATSERRPARRK